MTPEKIYNDLVVEKNTHSTLNALTPAIDDSQTLLTDVQSSSRVADWRLWMWVVAVVQSTIYDFFESYKKEITALAAAAIPGTINWYCQQALAFQYTHPLVWNGSKFVYLNSDPSSQIVARAAAIESGNLLLIKVAKLTSGVVTPLTLTELTAFRSYINQIRFAGTRLIAISEPADLLKVYYTIYYNAQIPLATLQSAVELAITTYIANLPFNSSLTITNLTDAIQLVTGVTNPVFTSASAKYASNPYTPVTINYTANAGHMIIDSSFPLSTTITYIANV
jgi:hypothetical protein